MRVQVLEVQDIHGGQHVQGAEGIEECNRRGPLRTSCGAGLHAAQLELQETVALEGVVSGNHGHAKNFAVVEPDSKVEIVAELELSSNRHNTESPRDARRAVAFRRAWSRPG